MTPRNLLFCFTGIDGSGKTTQAKLLVDYLADSGLKSVYVWSRGEVLAIRRFLLFMGRRAVGTSEREITNDQRSYQNYQSRKSKLMKYWPVRFLWSVLTQIEHLVQINRDIRPKIRQGYIVVCDRYLWDSTIDMAILNNKDQDSLLNNVNRFMWWLVPKPTITFFIDISPEEAVKRKNDIPSSEYVKRRAEFYRHLSTHVPFQLIDGCQDVTVIQKRINGLVNSYVGV
jgi:thymidylate kinase